MDRSLIVFELWCHWFWSSRLHHHLVPRRRRRHSKPLTLCTPTHTRTRTPPPRTHTPTCSHTRQQTHTLAPVGAFTSTHADFSAHSFQQRAGHLLATPFSSQVCMAETNMWRDLPGFCAISFRYTYVAGALIMLLCSCYWNWKSNRQLNRIIRQVP